MKIMSGTLDCAAFHADFLTLTSISSGFYTDLLVQSVSYYKIKGFKARSNGGGLANLNLKGYSLGELNLLKRRLKGVFR